MLQGKCMLSLWEIILMPQVGRHLKQGCLKWVSLHLEKILGHAIDQAVKLPASYSYGLGLSHASPCGMCCGHSDTGTGCLLKYFTCQYHFFSAPHMFLCHCCYIMLAVSLNSMLKEQEIKSHISCVQKMNLNNQYDVPYRKLVSKVLLQHLFQHFKNSEIFEWTSE